MIKQRFIMKTSRDVAGIFQRRTIMKTGIDFDCILDLIISTPIIIIFIGFNRKWTRGIPIIMLHTVRLEFCFGIAI